MKSVSTLLAMFLFIPLVHAEKGSSDVSTPVATSPDTETLPFDRAVINRYSLDHLPRSLSIRQGKDVWLGYDLERGKIYKVWRAFPGKPGLIMSGFVTQSAGSVWYEDKSIDTWQLRREGNTIPLTIRYLGCAQRETHFELTWELRHDAGALKLVERIPTTAAPDAERVTRELCAESLAPGEALLLPFPARKAWKLTNNGGDDGVSTLTGRERYRLTLR